MLFYREQLIILFPDSLSFIDTHSSEWIWQSTQRENKVTPRQLFGLKDEEEFSDMFISDTYFYLFTQKEMRQYVLDFKQKSNSKGKVPHNSKKIDSGQCVKGSCSRMEIIVQYILNTWCPIPKGQSSFC